MNYSVFDDEIERLKNKIIEQNIKSILVFGYGSLLWKVDFEHDRKIFGFINGYERKFWLLSDDHRGTSEKLYFIYCYWYFL